MVSLRKGLGLDKKGVISLVGAGGKTSLMFRLAHELAASGETVLTTTTTKIQPPTAEQSQHTILSDSPATILEKAKVILQQSPHLSAAASVLSSPEKLLGLPPEAILVLWNAGLFRWIIVEADGAAQLPLKAPASHEPVIPQCTHVVIGVLGLGAVGKTLDDQNVFRPERVATISGLELGLGIGADTLCAVLSHRQGIFKGAPTAAKKIAFLNQADVPGAVTAAHDIMDRLAGHESTDLSRVVLGSTWLDPVVLKYQDINPQTD